MKQVRTLIALILTLMLIVSSIADLTANAAEITTEQSGASVTFEASGFGWPTRGYVTCFALSNNKITTYSNPEATIYAGWIDGRIDQCKITDYNKIYLTFEVEYPTSKGPKKAWVRWTDFVYNTSSPKKTLTLSKSCKVYAKYDLSRQIGTAYQGDKISVVSTKGDLVQFIYPVGSNWKMGWAKLNSGRRTYIDVFASTKGKGYSLSQGRSSKSTSFTKGQIVYAWGYVHDQDNNLYKSYSSGTCNMTLSIYRPNGSCAHTCTYNNSDNNWIGTKLNTAGTWKIQCKISGSISGTNTQTITVKDPPKNEIVSNNEISSAASTYGISTGSNAYKALQSINSKYNSKVSNKNGTLVFMFEGVGNNSSSSVRMNAMCVVVKNQKIVYINRNSSTIPDYPFTPRLNDGTDMPTIKSGVYKFSTVNHRGKYAALNVNNASVVRFNSKYYYYPSSSTGINVHRRSSDSIPASSKGWVNSAGCIIIGKSGTASSGEYAKFIKAVGIVGSSANGSSKYSSSVSGQIIIDRTYAYTYLSNVGYSSGAISTIG